MTRSVLNLLKGSLLGQLVSILSNHNGLDSNGSCKLASVLLKNSELGTVADILLDCDSDAEEAEEETKILAGEVKSELGQAIEGHMERLDVAVEEAPASATPTAAAAAAAPVEEAEPETPTPTLSSSSLLSPPSPPVPAPETASPSPPPSPSSLLSPPSPPVPETASPSVDLDGKNG